MTALLQRYNLITAVACGLFFLFGITAVIQQEAAWLIIPFIFIVLKPISHFLITQTESLFWLLLILLPLSTELNITPSLGIDFPDEIFLLLLTAIGIAKIMHQPFIFFPLFRSPAMLLIALHLVWILATCFFSTEPLLSVKFFLAKCWYIIPLVLITPLVTRNSNDFAKMACCLTIPMALVIIQTLVRHGLYGFEFEAIKKTFFPFFRNHVNYSSMLVCLLPAGWALWKLTPAQTTRRKIIVALLVISAIGLILSYSRGAWLALLAGLITVAVLQKKWMVKTIGAALVSATLLFILLISNNNYLRFAPDHDRTVFHSNFSEHLSATITLKDISNAERFHRWVAGIRMIAEKPVTGFGPNSFYAQYPSFTVASFKTWVSDNPEHSTVHNYFLLTAIEQGIPGLLLLLALWIYLMVATQQLYHAFQSEFYRTVSLVTGVMLSMITLINLTSDMIETDKIGSLFWLCAGVIITLQIKLREERSAIAG